MIPIAKRTNIEINGKDYYRVTATIGKDTDGKPIRKQFYGTGKKEAEAKRNEYMNNINSGLNMDFKEMPIDKLMKIWLFNVVKVYSSYSTFDRYEGVYRNYIISSPLASMKVYGIKPLLLQCHYNKMADDGHSSNKIFTLNKLLKTFFNYALKEGYILKNPCFGLAIPKDASPHTSRSEVDPFTDEEIQQIINTANGIMRTIFQFRLATGLRRGELLGIQNKHVDIDNMTVQVNQALKRIKYFKSDTEFEYRTIIEDTKTPNSVRNVPIPSSMKTTLQQHMIAEEEKHIRLGIPYTDDTQFFTSEACTPFDGKNVGTAFRRLIKRAGIRYRCWHNIRHTYATKLFEADIPLKTVSMLLGHANIGITADTYTHVMPKNKTNAVEKLNYLFGT